jgi:hypothetical protein
MNDTPETDANSPWRYSITSLDGKTTLFVPADFAFVVIVSKFRPFVYTLSERVEGIGIAE